MGTRDDVEPETPESVEELEVKWITHLGAAWVEEQAKRFAREGRRPPQRTPTPLPLVSDNEAGAKTPRKDSSTWPPQHPSNDQVQASPPAPPAPPEEEEELSEEQRARIRAKAVGAVDRVFSKPTRAPS